MHKANVVQKVKSPPPPSPLPEYKILVNILAYYPKYENSHYMTFIKPCCPL